MKQQGFHIADRTHHAKHRDDPLPGSSQTSSKLADGLQGLMDMCNAGSLMTAPVQAMVCTTSSLPCNMKIPQTSLYHILCFWCTVHISSCSDRPWLLMQASGGKVEVVGTTHATTGVRSLVKSVVRGLKACQVRSTITFSTVGDCILPATALHHQTSHHICVCKKGGS